MRIDVESQPVVTTELHDLAHAQQGSILRGVVLGHYVPSPLYSMHETPLDRWFAHDNREGNTPTTGGGGHSTRRHQLS